MLYESQIIESVCRYLESKGHVILQRLLTTERGDDIISEKNGTFLYIEAKGATSSDTRSKRYGKPFTTAQVRDHVSVALFKCAEVLTRERGKENIKVGIALPDNENYRKCVSKIKKAIETLNIIVFWVSTNYKIIVETPKNY
ncbi:hypothetical protein [Priestia aryabhattai]|uniref:hypothetical protein n=1 Tax=Priestia aryabhattai TaxID=412384 RepID=UPI0027E45DDB|nr:hypothetical protein [Priestia aryabhattai]WJW97225.1 hypothetical protein P0182_14320 [Priestia aryabhattai]